MYVKDEIASQPEIWGLAAELGAAENNKDPVIAGKRIAFVGCGTSWFVAMSCAALTEASGRAEADAFTASEFPANRSYDRIVAITRSGTTTEVVELLKNQAETNSLVITAVLDSPAQAEADRAIILDFADEQSVVQTRFATAVIVMIRAILGEDLEPAIAQCEEVLKEALPTAEIDQVSFLGTGWTIGLANEAALKTRESAQFWAEAYPAMDYRHGPISIAQAGRMVWMFGAWPEGLEAQVVATGAIVVSSSHDPLVQLVQAQRLAVNLAVARGLNPDQPRGLTRSIILDAKNG